MPSENDNKKATLALGTQPVGKLLFQYALPAIIAMVASSMYNIIDRAFIGQVVGPIAISGLAITFPFMNLSGAFGAAVGVGSATAISLKLGQKDYLTAEEILGNTVTLNLIIGISYAVICYIFLDPILYFFGASKETIPYARSFMQIILLGNVVTHMYFGMNAVLRAASKPRQAMAATIFTVLMNIALDVLFILILHWGIRGAATATVLSQTMALMYQLKLFSNKKELLHFKRGIYKLKSRLVKNIINVGISPFLMNLCACLVIIFINMCSSSDMAAISP
jgi:putative MATE family efflux protein